MRNRGGGNNRDLQSRFLIDVAHDLQTPVAILKGNIEALRTKRKCNRKMILRTVTETLDDMSRTIDEFLAVARLNLCKDEFNEKEVAVHELLEEIFHDCLILAENKGVVLSYSGERGYVAGSKDKLKEVILNLVSNALKHTPCGEKIVLSTTPVENNVRIVVEDTGSGIAPENLQNIFERFYRIDAGDIRGTGVGLDICKKIIEAHRGSIVVESKIGRGSRFIIRLPSVG